MPLTPIGDIASGGMTETTPSETLTWETATDWNNHVDQAGVAHESTTDTDYADASVIRKGPSTEFLYPSASAVAGFWPLHDDTSPTADFSGNGNDGTLNGPTDNTNGLLGTSVLNFGGSDDIDMGDVAALDFGSGAFTWASFINPDGTGDFNIQNKSESGGSAIRATLRHRSNEYQFELDDNSSFLRAASGVQATAGSWELVVGVRESSDVIRIYVNGTEQGNADPGSYGSISNNQPHYLGEFQGSSDGFDGAYGYSWAFDTALSSSEVQTLYDIVFGESFLTTATKTFSSATAPDLQNLSYTLNSQTIVLDVIGSPGTASEEVVSQTLDGSTSYSLTWSNTHTDFRIKPRLSTSDPLVTPTFSRGELIET